MIRKPLPLMLVLASLAVATGCTPDDGAPKSAESAALAPTEQAPAVRPIDQEAVTVLAQEVARLRNELADVHAELDEARAADAPGALPDDGPRTPSVPKVEPEPELVVPVRADEDVARERQPGEQVALPLDGDSAGDGVSVDVEDVVLPPVVDRGIAASRYLYTEGQEEPQDETTETTEVVNERVVEREVIVEREVEYPTVVREQVVYETEVVYQYVPFRHTHYIGCGHHYYGCSCHSWYYALPRPVTYHLSPHDYDLWFGYGHGRRYGHHGGHGWGVSVYGAHVGFSYYDYDDHHDHHGHGHHDGYTARQVNRARRNGYNRGYRNGFRDGTASAGGTTIVNNGGTTVVNTRSRPGFETLPDRPLDEDRTRRGAAPSARSLARTDPGRTGASAAAVPVEARTRTPRGRETLARPDVPGTAPVASRPRLALPDATRSARPTARERADIVSRSEGAQPRSTATVTSNRTPVVGRAGRAPSAPRVAADRESAPRVATARDATPGPSVARARARPAETRAPARTPAVGNSRPVTQRSVDRRSTPEVTRRTAPTLQRSAPPAVRHTTQRPEARRAPTPERRTYTPRTSAPRSVAPRPGTSRTVRPAPSVPHAPRSVSRAPTPQVQRRPVQATRPSNRPAPRAQPRSVRTAPSVRSAPRPQRSAPRRSTDTDRRRRDRD